MSLQRVWATKQTLKQQLSNYKIDVLVDIFEGLKKNLTYREIHKLIVADTLKAPIKNQNVFNVLCGFAKKIVKQKKVKEKIFYFNKYGEARPEKLKKDGSINKSLFNEQQLTPFFLAFMNKNPIDPTIYEQLNHYEELAKAREIERTMQEARANGNIFYLLSEHEDCAIDHIETQGTIVVDADYKRYVKDEEVIKFIEENNFQTFQYITGKPIWFITRPNCRHYYRVVSINEVMMYSASALIEKYGMHHQVGIRKQMQTIRHNVGKGWYSITNIKAIINKYKERLKLLMKLRKVGGSVENEINKTKLLLNKWQELLKKYETKNA